MGTPWDAANYDRTSQPQRRWAGDVLARLGEVPSGSTVLDVGCGTGLVTEQLCALVPAGRVIALDASPEMVELARARLGERAEVRCVDVVELDLDGDIDVVFSTAADAFVRTSILAAHFERLPEERREPLARAVMERVRLPLDYVRLNVSALRPGGADEPA